MARRFEMPEPREEPEGRERKALRGEVDMAVKDAFERYVKADNKRRKRAGAYVSGGEQRGTAYAQEDILCWFLSLSDDDRARIRREGRALSEQVAALPIEEEALPFGQRGESVFREAYEPPDRSVDRGWVSGHDTGGRPTADGGPDLHQPKRRPRRRCGQEEARA